MPFLIRPSDQHCHAFMSQPNTHRVDLLNGDTLFFSLPFHTESLDPLRPQDLDRVSHFLSGIRGIVEEEAGPTGVRNVEHVRSVITRRLKNVLSFGPATFEAWHEGHGFPVFDNSQQLVSFTLDGETKAVERSKELIERPMRHPIVGRNREVFDVKSEHPHGLHEDEITVMHWEKNDHEAFEWRQNGERVEFCIYGGHFLNFTEWELFREKLSDHELQLLDDGSLVIRNIPYGGWRLERSSNRGNEDGDGDFDEQGSTRHRDASDVSASVCEECLHQEHEDVRLASSDIFPSDETCCCTPQRLTSPPPNTPTNGLKRPSVDSRGVITFCGATFSSLADWTHFESSLERSELDLLRCGIFRLEGDSQTGWSIMSGPNVQLQRSRLTQLKAKAKAAAMVRSRILTQLSGDLERTEQEQSSKQEPSSPLEGFCSPSCPDYRDPLEPMHPTRISRTVPGSSTEDTNLEGSQFTETPDLQAFQDANQISHAPGVVPVRPITQVNIVQPAPRSHATSDLEPRSSSLQQPLAYTVRHRQTVHPPHLPPRDTFAMPTPPRSPPLVIGHDPIHKLTRSAQSTPPISDELETLLKLAEEMTKASLSGNSTQEQVVYVKDLSRQLATNPNVIRRHSIAPQGTARDRLSKQLPIRSSGAQLRFARRPQATQRASDAVTNRTSNDSTSLGPRKSRYQAYAEDSPEDSRRPSPEMWRDV